MFFLNKTKANAKLQRALSTRNFTDAIASYRKLIAKNPTDHELFNNLGVAYLESGDVSASIEAFQNANRHYPACTHYNNLGRALLLRKEYDAARIAFAEARQLDPKDPQPWYNITVLLRDEGSVEESYQELIAFLRFHPMHGNGLNDMGCHYLAHGESDAAMQCFERAVESDVTAVSARLNLIRLLCDAQRFSDATPHLETLAQQGFHVRVRAENDRVSIDLNGSPFYRSRTSP